MTNVELFSDPEPTPTKGRYRPLAERLRPSEWNSFYGAEKIPESIADLLMRGQGVPPSLILWGPPGCGKTTLAKLIGKSFSCSFVEFSAVLGGVKEVREIVDSARRSTRPTILFVDEIHRFSRAQQDAFLPHIERGTIVLIGATTENPSFYLTGALLSRAKVIALAALSEQDLLAVINRAEKELSLLFDEKSRELLIATSAGDARKLLNLIEGIANHRQSCSESVSFKEVQDFLGSANTLIYDRSGEEHYNVVSAFIKSMRGSDPDAALYWGFRMIEAGEDPRFVIRRMMIFASEDIGNADPRALQIATATADAYERLGLPEGRIPIAQCITYLATAPKSNRSYHAMNQVLEVIKSQPRAAVPMHLRNAPTKLMSELGYGEGYQYPHDSSEAFVRAQYLPDIAKDRRFYEPRDSGYEKSIRERMLVRGQDPGKV